MRCYTGAGSQHNVYAGTIGKRYATVLHIVCKESAAFVQALMVYLNIDERTVRPSENLLVVTGLLSERD